MPILRVYVDTSVFGGVGDEEFSEASRHFFDQVNAGRYRVLLSRVTTTELELSPASIREVLENLRAGQQRRRTARGRRDGGVCGLDSKLEFQAYCAV